MCEKLQAAIVNPSAVNPMCLESTQSISSDEAPTPSPILISRDDTDEGLTEGANGGPPLLTPYDSTDCDSDDGT